LRNKKPRVIVILLIVVLIAVAIDIAVRLSVPAKPKQPSRCLTIPIKFAMKYPNCTNKLLKAANLTSVHIVPPETTEARRKNLSRLN
jgi:hypothetical protein